MQRKDEELNFDVDFNANDLNDEQIGSDLQAPEADEDFDFDFDDEELSGSDSSDLATQEDTSNNYGYTQGNTGYGQQDSGYTQQDTMYTQQDNGYTQQDTGYTQNDSGLGYNQSNTVYSQTENTVDDIISEDEPTQSNVKLSKKQKKQQEKLNKQQGTNDTKQSPVELQDLVLYCIVDKTLPGMLGYFRNYGLNVSRIFTSIDEARDAILMQVEPCRIIIMDTGTGRFSLMGSRKAIIDLMGISDVDNKISMFYTDSVIRSEVSISEEVEGKQVEWYKYRSTADVLAVSLQKKKTENYVYDMEANDEYHPIDSLDIMGLNANCAESMNLGSPTIYIGEIAMNMDVNSGANQLQAYEVKY